VLNAFVKSFLTRIGRSVLLKDLLRKIDKTNSISQKIGSGRKQTVQITQNNECVVELICSQEDNAAFSKIPRKIQKGTLLT